MQLNKIISVALISLFMVTGCASMGGGKDDAMPAGTTLISPQTEALSNGMSNGDKAKLLQLVSGARADETSTWSGYEFTSLNVFVNSDGQPCREYRVKETGVFGNKQSQQVACRNSRGVWKVK